MNVVNTDCSYEKRGANAVDILLGVNAGIPRHRTAYSGVSGTGAGVQTAKLTHRANRSAGGAGNG